MATYQPGIPTGTVDLDVDYLNIQGNFTQANVVFGVDHVPFDNTTKEKGYHEDIHFNPESTTVTNPPNNYVAASQYPQGIPSIVAGIGQLFSSAVTDGSSTDTGLYWLSGNGLKVALTRNFQPAALANGYTFLPGGIILQWGLKTITPNSWPTTDQTLTFAPSNKNFPNACLAVFTTFRSNSTSGGDIGINSISTTNFHWQFGGSSSASYSGFYWVAIGY